MNMRELKEEINAYLEKVEFYERKLEEIGLTFKTYNCLHRYKFKQLSDLIGKNFDDLMSIKNLGEKGVNEIFQLAAKFGLKIQNNVITGSICEQSDEIKQKIDKLGSVKIKDMGFNFKTLEYLECCYTLSDILDKRISNLRSEHKDVYQDFIYVMGKYGFTLNKTGYFVLIDLTTKDSILFRALKKLGLKALFLCDKKYLLSQILHK